MLKRKFYPIKVIAIILSITAIITSFSACVTNSENESENYYTFTDDLGRTVVLKSKPQKVATLMGSLADMWILAGGKICAAPDDAWEDFDIDTENAVNLGKLNNPSVELLFSSNAQFVIASASLSAQVELKETLEKANITVAYFDINDFDSYLRVLDIFTDINERKDLYKTNGLDIQERIEQVKQNHAIKNVSSSEKTYLFLRASSGYIRAKGSDKTILGEMLKDMGYINIADNDELILENLSIESIVKQNPYRIFIVQVGDDEEKMKENVQNMMDENKLWYTLDAVKNNRVYYMDKTLFNMKPNNRWDEAYEILANTLER